jgi:hypothetical protein
MTALPDDQKFNTGTSRVGRTRKSRFVLVFALVGLVFALVLGAMRIYLVHSGALDRDLSFGAAFDELTVTLWPGGFYLSLIEANDSFGQMALIATIAILSNALLYGLIGWAVWTVLRFLRLVKG